MKAVRALAVLVLVVLFSPSCGEAPTTLVTPAAPVAPAPEASFNGYDHGYDHDGYDRVPPGLLKCSDLPYESRTRTIGVDGGRISVGPHKLDIPQGALTRPTAITMTVLTGLGANGVEFAPEGLQFTTPATLSMSYANCSLHGNHRLKRIAYTDDDLNIITYLVSSDNLHDKRVTGKVNHFSRYFVADYMVAW